MLIDQIWLQPYDVGAIIIPIFTNEETEAQGLSNLLNLGNDETVVQTSLGQWSSGRDELHLFKDPKSQCGQAWRSWEVGHVW